MPPVTSSRPVALSHRRRRDLLALAVALVLLLPAALATGQGSEPISDPNTGVLSWPYYDFDSHWNRLGHRIAGREAEAFLRGQGWACAR